MRTSSRIKNMKKKPHRCKVNKKKYSSKSIAMSDRNFNISSMISRSNLENINEVLRLNKLRHAERKGSWKLIPKDSCEVYKDRRKRQTKNKRRREDEEKVSDSNNRSESNYHRKPERKQKHIMVRKNKKTPGKSKQRLKIKYNTGMM